MTNVFTQDTRQLRDDALVTPVTFRAAIADSATTVFAGKAGKYLLIRQLSWSNSTGGALTYAITVGSDTYMAGKSAAANDGGVISAMSNMLIPDGEDLKVTASAASGIVVFGWGLLIQGARNWTL